MNAHWIRTTEAKHCATCHTTTVHHQGKCSVCAIKTVEREPEPANERERQAQEVKYDAHWIGALELDGSDTSLQGGLRESGFGEFGPM